MFVTPRRRRERAALATRRGLRVWEADEVVQGCRRRLGGREAGMGAQPVAGALRLAARK